MAPPTTETDQFCCVRCGESMAGKFRATHEQVCAMVERLHGNADDVERWLRYRTLGH